MTYLKTLQQWKQANLIDEAKSSILTGLYENYIKACNKAGHPKEQAEKILANFLDLVQEQVHAPFNFPPFHKKITDPIDYHKFALDFVRPLIDWENSYIQNEHNAELAESFISKKENVILFANHQIEPDPQILSLLLEKHFPKLANDMIFVAGDRVTSDPVSIPFSMGTNLLCIYSKKYIDIIPEDKERKLLHNKKTMQVMNELLQEGGKCIYVAPSGGRDRKNDKGIVEVAPFDPQSIELFYLIAAKSKSTTHFFPLSLNTYDLLPPPAGIQVELGEQRNINYAAAQVCFGNEITESTLSESLKGITGKKERRQAKSSFIHKVVKENYLNLINN